MLQNYYQKKKRHLCPRQSPNPSLRKFKKPKRKKFSNTSGRKGKIAIVIDDVGMNIKQSQAAINLPPEVTLAMLPYAKTVKDLARKAKGEGHELIIHTPMEAMSSDVPLGSMALYDNMDKTAFNAEFNKIAASFDGYVGINNHMGSRLTQNSQAMDILMGQLKKRGLFFLDSKTIGNSIAAHTAETHGIPNATRDVFLDHEETPEFVIKALRKAEKIASQTGSAIAIGHPKQITMSALRKWIPTLEEKGYELVPLSELITYPEQPVIQQSKIETKVEEIEPAAGEEVEDLQPLSFAAPVPTASKQIEFIKDGQPPISYPVN